MQGQKIAVIPGDGIGTEVAEVGVRVLETAAELHGVPLDFVWHDYGAEKYLAEGVTLPQAAFEDFRDNYDAIYLGALGDPRVPDMAHAKDILLGLRFRLDLYVNLRPARLLHPDLTPLKNKKPEDLDFVIFRENTEGLYVGVGGRFKRGTPDEIAINEMICTRKGVERIIRAAFEWARENDRKRVCMADKANVLRDAHGLWQDVFIEVAEEYADISARHLYADVLAMELVRAPEDFDVIVTSNMLGDILSDLAAQLVGGLGLAPSGNIHPGRVSLFEPVHGSAPPLAGKDIANPLAMVLTGAQMLEHLGHGEAAMAIESAVVEALRTRKVTRDLGGELGTRAVGDALVALLRQPRRAA
ncbi:MAG: isocitrate/isopropylmalate dehydrogenase family protein [Myxococcales bacterium]|nr:isocitrate/isopropylmalate dehydrogenase family protein [Myxococcales bacterium]MCB9551836.1 isocitrate/isopropylmalate dehydrogenase family protein [Myxococcales bacterium]